MLASKVTTGASSSAVTGATIVRCSTAICQYRRQVPNSNRGRGGESIGVLLPHHA